MGAELFVSSVKWGGIVFDCEQNRESNTDHIDSRSLCNLYMGEVRDLQ